MANLTETPAWEEGIYQFETSDPVMGGPNGIDNRPTRQLANRTAWLKQQLETAATDKQAGRVMLSSATNSTSEDKAATPKAVKAAWDKAAAAQEAVDGISLDWGGITGKPNSLAGYGIGNFKVEAFSGDLNTLKTDGIYAVLSPSQSRNLPSGSRGGKLLAVSGADVLIAHHYWH